MKNQLLTLALAAGLQGLLGTPNTAHATNYAGNGNTGFNGALGNGMLAVNNNGTGGFTFVFTFGNNQTNLGGNDIVIYVDTGNGNGVGTSTAALTDAGDGSRSPVSEFSTNGRSTLSFGSLMSPQYGMDFSLSNVNIFTLSNNSGNFGYAYDGGASATSGTTGGGVTYSVAAGATSSVLTANVPAVNFGLSSFSGKTLKFVAIQVSETGYSSNEATVGLTTTVVNGLNTFGYGTTQTISAINSFAAIPEPGTWAMLAAGFGTLIGIRRIRRRSAR